jgi:cytidylate kinase
MMHYHKNVFNFIALCLILVCCTSFAGKVVFLHGTACSGKTSLCREFLGHDEWRVVSEDDIFYERAAVRWQHEFPQEFKIIEEAIDKENILHAVMRNQILFRAQASDALRRQAKAAIGLVQEKLDGVSREKREDPNSWSNMLRRHITQTIIDLAKTNNVIVDTWFIKEGHIAEIAQQCEVMHVAVYCPFSDIVKRTMKRNYEALMNGKEISSLRFFHQTLNSFIGLYKFSDFESGSIDTLEKDAVVHGCDIVSLQLRDSANATGATKAFTRGEFSLQEFEEYRQNLLAQFKSVIVYVCPKFKADVIIRTDQNSPAECAGIVRDLAKSK